MQNISHTFRVGENRVVKGLDLAIQKMKKQEESLITIDPKYCCQDNFPYNTLTNQKSYFKVELTDFKEKVKNRWDWDTPECLIHAEELK